MAKFLTQNILHLHKTRLMLAQQLLNTVIMKIKPIGSFFLILFYLNIGLAYQCIDLFKSTEKSIYALNSLGHPVGIKRIETLFGKSIEILDVSDSIQEISSSSDSSLKIFDISKVFSTDVTFMGFGRPNVYIATKTATGKNVKFSAKSLKRANSKIERTGGKVQSGILLVFKDLNATEKQLILDAAEKHEGTRRWTNLAQYERKMTSERISHSFLARAKRGLFNGGSVPLGYCP